MKDLTEIIGEVIDNINLTLNVESIVGNKIFLCETLHLTVLKIVEDSVGNQYKIIDFLNDEWIEVEPIGASPDPFDDSVVICPSITYLYGTPSSVSNEYVDLDAETRKKTPFIWLLENYDEEFFGAESSIERNSSIRCFFMDETDEVKWTNSEHHRLVIQPMQNLTDAFVSSIKSDPLFKTFSTYSQKPRVRFGVYVENKGNESKIFDEDLSGCELKGNFERYKCSKKC